MSLSYIVKEGFAGFWRSRFSSLISIMSVGISLFLLGVFAAITTNFNQVAEKLRERIEVEVFLKDISESTAKQYLLPKLRKIKGVKEVSYVSKDQALEIFRKDSGTDPLEILESNPLPASFRLRIAPEYNRSDSIRTLTDRLRSWSEVETVVYRKQFLEVIESRAYAFQISSLIIGVILAISSVILVANTIQLAVYAKRDMIRTMKLVGATPMFIRLPFLIEGVVHGLIGGLCATLLLLLVVLLVLKPIAADVLLSISVSAAQYLYLFLFGGTLGLLGSALAMRRFLREAIIIAG